MTRLVLIGQTRACSLVGIWFLLLGKMIPNSGLVGDDFELTGNARDWLNGAPLIALCILFDFERGSATCLLIVAIGFFSFSCHGFICAAIATVVTIAEILKNNGFAAEKKITTSTVGIKDESRGRPVQKAKIEILLGKSEKFDELMAAAAAEQAAAAAAAEQADAGATEEQES